jgi:hypothetical protein
MSKPLNKKLANVQKKESQSTKPAKKINGFQKALEQSKVLNNFGTCSQFTKDLGLELLKGTATIEHIETLKSSIQGIKEFIDLLEEKLNSNQTK